MNVPGEKNRSFEEKTDQDAIQHFGQTVLRSIAYAEALQGFVDPENPVYDQN